MSYIRLTDDDLIEVFYASDRLAQLTDGRDDPSAVLDALRGASEAEIAAIANECASKAIDIAVGVYGRDEDWLEGWRAKLSHVATELRRPQEPRNAWPRGRGA